MAASNSSRFRCMRYCQNPSEWPNAFSRGKKHDYTFEPFFRFSLLHTVEGSRFNRPTPVALRTSLLFSFLFFLFSRIRIQISQLIKWGKKGAFWGNKTWDSDSASILEKLKRRTKQLSECHFVSLARKLMKWEKTTDSGGEQCLI